MISGTAGLDFSATSLFNVKGKVALISNGCSTTGIAAAVALAQNGAKVYVVSQSEEALRILKVELNEPALGRCEYLVANLTSKEGCVSLCNAFKKIESELHILINNSGATWGGEWEEFPDQGWDQAMASHVKGLLYVTACLTSLLATNATPSEPGRIINIPSVISDNTEGTNQEQLSLDYDTSKSAVSHLTTVLSTSLASKSINVNAILPDIEIAHENANVVRATISEALNTTEQLNAGRDLASILMFLVSLGGVSVTGARIESEKIGEATTNRWWGRKKPSVGCV